MLRKSERKFWKINLQPVCQSVWLFVLCQRVCVNVILRSVPERAVQATRRQPSPNHANRLRTILFRQFRFGLLLLGGSVEVRLTLGTRFAGAQLRAMGPIGIIFIRFKFLSLIIVRIGIGIVTGRSKAKPAAPKGLFLLVHQLASLSILCRRRSFVILLDDRGGDWSRRRRNAAMVKWLVLLPWK